ncbi:MAG: RHS repeat-associated core domain-containing protein [Terriglobales bacterium]
MNRKTVNICTYDGDGNRVSETVGGVTTSYLVDTANPTGYAQAVDELQSGTVTRTYSYGLERINENQALNGTWTASFYGYDGHGSVRQLFNSSGGVTDSYDYDAFGNLISSTGSTPNNYLFAGEQYDPALSLYYNHARYLNTATGRFWSMDTYEGDPQSPGSLHKYVYVGGNPVDRKDPSGHDFDTAEALVSAAASFTIAAISTISVEVLGGVGVGALTIHYLPSNWYYQKPTAAVVGVQTSFKLNQVIQGVSNPAVEGVAFGLQFAAVLGGFELLAPLQGPVQLWPYAYWGGSVGVTLPSGGSPFTPGFSIPGLGSGLGAIKRILKYLSVPAAYAGAVWEAYEPDDYAGPFFCVESVFVPGGPHRPDATVCSSAPKTSGPHMGEPGAYSLTFGLGSEAKVQASSTIYYSLGPISLF